MSGPLTRHPSLVFGPLYAAQYASRLDLASYRRGSRDVYTWCTRRLVHSRNRITTAESIDDDHAASGGSLGCGHQMVTFVGERQTHLMIEYGKNKRYNRSSGLWISSYSPNAPPPHCLLHYLDSYATAVFGHWNEHVVVVRKIFGSRIVQLHLRKYAES